MQIMRMMDGFANRAAILRLRNSFGMVTRETSLIVLDRVEDYARYEIVPPESLRSEYEKLLTTKVQNKNNERNHHLDEVAAKFAQKEAWWKTIFPKGNMPASPPEIKETRESARHTTMAMAPPPREMATPAPTPIPAPIIEMARAKRPSSAAPECHARVKFG